MPTDSPAHRETATVRGRGRRCPGRRLPPARGARPRRCGSAWRPSAPPPAGTGAPEAPLHVQLPDGADLHDPPALGKGAPKPPFLSSFRTGPAPPAPPPSKIGQPSESRTASSMSFASTIEKPPMMSLVSAYGPSVTVFFLPVTVLPVRSSGWPWFLRCPWSASCFIHAIQACMLCCIRSGDPIAAWLASLVVRYRYTYSLMMTPPGVHARPLAGLRLLDVRAAPERTFFPGWPADGPNPGENRGAAPGRGRRRREG